MVAGVETHLKAVHRGRKITNRSQFAGLQPDMIKMREDLIIEGDQQHNLDEKSTVMHRNPSLIRDTPLS